MFRLSQTLLSWPSFRQFYAVARELNLQRCDKLTF